jgi:hypothetical protein
VAHAGHITQLPDLGFNATMLHSVKTSLFFSDSENENKRWYVVIAAGREPLLLLIEGHA